MMFKDMYTHTEKDEEVTCVHQSSCIKKTLDLLRLCLPADDEVRHGHQKGPKRHQQTADRYDLGSVEFGTKITHKGNHQQIPYRVRMIREGDGDDREAENMWVLTEFHSGWFPK